MTEYRPFRFLNDLGRLAVIWLNTPYYSRSHIPSDFSTLWNGAAHRVCTDGAANSLMKHCINKENVLFENCDQTFKNPDLIVGDFDSITNESKDYFLSLHCVEIVKIEDQNSTDLTKSLNVLNEKLGSLSEEVPQCIVLVGGFNGRFDHMLGTLNAIYMYMIHPSSLVRTIFAIDGVNVITILPKGENRIVLDHSKITKVCGIFPICQRPTNVFTKGFRWNLNNTPLEYGGVISNSNQILTDEQVITSSEPV